MFVLFARSRARGSSMFCAVRTLAGLRLEHVLCCSRARRLAARACFVLFARSQARGSSMFCAVRALVGSRLEQVYDG